MEVANSVSFSFLRPSITTIMLNATKNQLLLVTRIANPSKVQKLSKRRNSLRPKILKIATKPYNPKTPEIPLQELPPNQNDESQAAVSGENDKVEEFWSSEAVNAGVDEFSGRSFVRYGVYLIGVFVFQTVLAVWVMGISNSERKVGDLDSLDDKGKVLLNGNEKTFSFDFELEEKIEEIREMARKARNVEKNKGESSNSGTKIGIEKEIEKRLLKLQKRLNSNREKLPRSYVNYLSKYGKVEDEATKKQKTSLDVGKGKETLMFKKKLKFRSPWTDPSKVPKGFGDSEKRKLLKVEKSGLGVRDKMVANRGVGGGAVEVSEEKNGEIQKERRDLEGDDGRGLVVQKSRELRDDWKNLDKGMRSENGGKEASHTRKSRNGVIQENRPERASVEVANLTNSGELGMETDQNFERESWETVEESKEHIVSSRNRSSRCIEVEKNTTPNTVPKKQSNVETDMWWLNLSHVLVVLMHRGSDPKGTGGLYTLKNQNESSYTVAFEDHGDANNFCFLLESFFEDLGDVRADIIPLSVKELHAAVNSKKWNVIVLKKGQLQLYAGQPFADVEMALHALIKETQKWSIGCEGKT